MPTVALGKQVWDKNLSCNRALYRNNEFKKLPNKAIFRYQFSSMFKLVSGSVLPSSQKCPSRLPLYWPAQSFSVWRERIVTSAGATIRQGGCHTKIILKHWNVSKVIAHSLFGKMSH